MRPVDTPPGLRPDPSAARPVAGLRADPGAAKGPLLLDARARAMQPPRKDPSPSRWAWRLERLMLTPLFLLTLRAGVPFVICLALGTIWLSDPARQQRIAETVAETRASIEERPEFMVQLMAIDGAPDPVSRAIRETLPLDFPISSFDLDLPALRQTVLDLPPVRDAALRVRPGGILQIDITPRVPVALWRTPEGLSLMDETGAFIAQLPQRQLRPDLPVLAGPGADAAVPEGLVLHALAVQSLGDRVRGLVRMGERRWDVVLDRDQRILLPEDAPASALRRVLALDMADDVLKRDVARLDMRLASRPTLRMTPNATEEWRRIKTLERGSQ